MYCKERIQACIRFKTYELNLLTPDFSNGSYARGKSIVYRSDDRTYREELIDEIVEDDNLLL